MSIRNISIRNLPPPLKTYTADDIWIMLVTIIHDQLQVDLHEIRYHASFQNDLDVD